MDTNNIIKDIRAIKMRKRAIWKPFLEKYKINIICEIGVREGINFKKMIEHNPTLAVAVDLWLDDGIISRNDGANTQKEIDSFYNKFKEEMKDKPFVDIYRGYSFDVVKKFPDEFFDLVYIDADHTYNACLRDIRDWYPKVKNGGLLLGDDYVKGYKAKFTRVRFGVVEAVQTFLEEKHLEDDLFIFPRHNWGILKK